MDKRPVLFPFCDPAWLYSRARRAIGQARQLRSAGLFEEADKAIKSAERLRESARQYRQNPPRWRIQFWEVVY